MFASRKRAREDDEDGLQQFAPDLKRSSLPFRTSPNTQHIRPLSESRSRPTLLLTQTITPADSEDESSPPDQSSIKTSIQLPWQPSLSNTLQLDRYLNSDMDMADSAPSHISQHWAQFPHTPSPKASPCTVEPPESVLRETKNNPTGGRLPTPIYGHFQQSIDAKMDMGGDSETQHLRSQQEIDYELYVLRRRLPTPIEEDEAMDSCTGGSEDGMTFLARDCVGQGIDPSLETSHEVLRSSENRSSYGSLSETPRSSIPPPRSTRMSFSMGVRANCDLCQRRVPGHSNHIFRS